MTVAVASSRTIQRTQQAGTMFRPVGIVVVYRARSLLLRGGFRLGGWLRLSRLGWLGGFFDSLGRGSFFRGHIPWLL